MRQHVSWGKRDGAACIVGLRKGQHVSWDIEMRKYVLRCKEMWQHVW